MGLLNLFASTDVNPRTLFANNEPGVVFDAEESFRRGWMWQDTAGQTAAAAAGDPIGLQLDTSRGGLDNLGADLVSNGGFDSDTVWTKGANWTIGSGVATKTGGAANNLTQTITSTAGLWYRCTATVTRTAGTLTISLGTSGTSFAVSASGTYTFFLLAGSSTQTLTFAGDSSFAGTVDAVTAKLVPGTHRYQSVSGSRPVLARIPEGGRRNLLTYTEDASNAYWTKSTVTISPNTLTGPFGVQDADTIVATGAGGAAYLGSSAITAPSSGVHTASVYLKKSNHDFACILASGFSGATNTLGYFDLANGTTPTAGATITPVGNGWYRCTVSPTIAGGDLTGDLRVYIAQDIANYTWATPANATGKELYWFGAQFELASSATAYQKVTLTSDVTESGKRDCWGVLYDGSDDSFITASVDFNTWTQATRRNLLVDTESFGSSTWTKTNTTATENTTTAPDGTTTADSIQESASGTFNRRVSYSSTTLSAINYTFSFYAKKNGINFVRFYESTTGSGRVTWFDINTGAVGTKDAAHTASITSVGSGWYRCSVVFLAGTTADTPYIGLSDVNGSITYTGTGSDGIYLWGAQLEAGTLTDYQRVGTDKMTVMSAVRKLSDAAAGCIAELSANMSLNNGSIRLLAPQSAGVDDYSFASKGTAQATATGTGMAAPATAVLVGIGDISGDSSIIRKNGVQANSSAVDQGSGNYGNYPLYFGRRGNAASLIYNGYEFATIIRGVTTSDGVIRSFEKDYLARRAGVVLP